MKITLITVGKIKEKYFSMAIEEYVKRLSRYCKLEMIEAADEKTLNHASETEERMIKNKEGDRIVKMIPDSAAAYVIALAIDGAALDSMQFSSKIEQLGVRGISHIIFIIGGSLGLSDEILNRADEQISFSKMTFPHQLMRVIFLEQLYRSYRIQNKEPYHK